MLPQVLKRKLRELLNTRSSPQGKLIRLPDMLRDAALTADFGSEVHRRWVSALGSDAGHAAQLVEWLEQSLATQKRMYGGDIPFGYGINRDRFHLPIVFSSQSNQSGIIDYEPRLRRLFFEQLNLLSLWGNRLNQEFGGPVWGPDARPGSEDAYRQHWLGFSAMVPFFKIVDVTGDGLQSPFFINLGMHILAFVRSWQGCPWSAKVYCPAAFDLRLRRV